MNYYPFHIGDYASATRHLSWEEDAAFRRLLDVYYTHEKPLPAELRAVCRLVLATTESQRQAVETVLGEFFELTECGWVNRRADQEISAMREKQQKQRDKANKRWHKPEEEPGNASAMPQHVGGDAAASEIDANAMPPTPTPTPTPNSSLGADAPPADGGKKPKVGLVTVERPEDVSEQVWNDFVTHRKANRNTITATVVSRFRSQAEKAGISLEAALAETCGTGWRGFNAEWYLKNQRANQTAKRDIFAGSI